MTNELSFHKVLVPPEVAAKWLATSPGNRQIKESRVNEWVAEMVAGAWRIGPTIDFDVDGRLINGHHRLHAVIKYGHPVSFIVLRGLDPAVRDVIDDGASRSFGDVLAMNGVPNAKNAAAVTNLLLKWEEGLTLTHSGTRQRRLNRHAQLAAWKRFQSEVEDSLPRGQKLSRALRFNLSLATALYIILARVDESYAKAFCDLLISGEEGSGPVYLLRELLIKDAMQRLSGGRQSVMTDSRKAALFIKAWNYWLDGAEVKHLSWRAVGPSAEPFPVPRCP